MNDLEKIKQIVNQSDIPREAKERIHDTLDRIEAEEADREEYTRFKSYRITVIKKSNTIS